MCLATFVVCRLLPRCLRKRELWWGKVAAGTTEARGRIQTSFGAKMQLADANFEKFKKQCTNLDWNSVELTSAAALEDMLLFPVASMVNCGGVPVSKLDHRRRVVMCSLELESHWGAIPVPRAIPILSSPRSFARILR